MTAAAASSQISCFFAGIVYVKQMKTSFKYNCNFLIQCTQPNFREWNQGRVAGIKACLQEKTKNHLMFVTDVAWSVSDIDGRIPPYLIK